MHDRRGLQQPDHRWSRRILGRNLLLLLQPVQFLAEPNEVLLDDDSPHPSLRFARRLLQIRLKRQTRDHSGQKTIYCIFFFSKKRTFFKKKIQALKHLLLTSLKNFYHHF